MDERKCECGRWKLKDKEQCFWCSDEISDDMKFSARARGGSRPKRIPLDVPDILTYLPIESESDLSRFLNRLLVLAAENYSDNFERFLTQSLRIIPRLNDLLTYKMLSELRERLDQLKDGYLIPEKADYVELSKAD